MPAATADAKCMERPSVGFTPALVPGSLPRLGRTDPLPPSLADAAMRDSAVHPMFPLPEPSRSGRPTPIYKWLSSAMLGWA